MPYRRLGEFVLTDFGGALTVRRVSGGRTIDRDRRPHDDDDDDHWESNERCSARPPDRALPLSLPPCPIAGGRNLTAAAAALGEMS